MKTALLSPGIALDSVLRDHSSFVSLRKVNGAKTKKNRITVLVNHNVWLPLSSKRLHSISRSISAKSSSKSQVTTLESDSTLSRSDFKVASREFAIYYVDSSVSLEQVAKRHRTTVKELLRVNGAAHVTQAYEHAAKGVEVSGEWDMRGALLLLPPPSPLTAAPSSSSPLKGGGGGSPSLSTALTLKDFLHILTTRHTPSPNRAAGVWSAPSMRVRQMQRAERQQQQQKQKSQQAHQAAAHPPHPHPHPPSTHISPSGPTRRDGAQAVSKAAGVSASGESQADTRKPGAVKNNEHAPTFKAEAQAVQAPKVAPGTLVHARTLDINTLKMLHSRNGGVGAAIQKDMMLMVGAPWCRYCTEMMPAYDQLALGLKSDKSVVVAYMRGDTDREFSASLGVRTFPTVLGFPRTGGAPFVYGSEDRRTESLLRFSNYVCRSAPGAYQLKLEFPENEEVSHESQAAKPTLFTTMSQSITRTPARIRDQFFGASSGLKVMALLTVVVFSWRRFSRSRRRIAKEMEEGELSPFEVQMKIMQLHQDRVREGLEKYSDIDKSKVLAEQVEGEMGMTVVFFAGLLALWAKLQLIIHARYVRVALKFWGSMLSIHLILMEAVPWMGSGGPGVKKKGVVSLPELEEDALGEDEVEMNELNDPKVGTDESTKAREAAVYEQ